MHAQRKLPQRKASPPPLTWWKKLLLALFGSYLAAKLFGILLPDVNTAVLTSHETKDRQTSPLDNSTDEYPDDTWDDPSDEHYEDDYGYDMEEPVDDPLYDDWADWNEGYDDDHFR